VLVALVEPVTPEVLPAVPDPVVLLASLPVVLPVEPVPLEPMELVPPEPVVPLVVVSVLLPVVPPVVPAVLPLVLGVLGLLGLPVPAVDGLVVVLDDELEVPVLPLPAVPASCLPQAASDKAATTVKAAAAVWVRDIFIRKLLRGLCSDSGKGSLDCPTAL